MAFSLFGFSVRAKPFCRFPRRQIYVLGIESSCDDTSAAIVDHSGMVLGESHFSQATVHLAAGGIIPSLASNLHRQYIKNVVDTSVKQSGLNIRDLDVIAVTVKPGLILSLKAGVEYAKDLCSLYSKPLIPIHHMEAHALTARMIEDVKFPFLVFLLSGGHCLLALAKSVRKFYRLGTTLDRSPGSVLDKIARRAKLQNVKKFRGLAGGAAVEAAALGGDPSVFKFKEMILQRHNKSCDFSYSGIESVAEKYVAEEEKKHKLGPDEVIPNVNDLCIAVLVSMTRHMCQRVEIAFNYISEKNLLKDDEKVLVMSGGVACNKFMQEAIKEVCIEYGYKLVVPPGKLCTDNGVMIAWNGVELLKENFPVVQPDNLSSVKEHSRTPFGEDISKDVRETCKDMKFKFMNLKLHEMHKRFEKM